MSAPWNRTCGTVTKAIVCDIPEKTSITWELTFTWKQSDSGHCGPLLPAGRLRGVGCSAPQSCPSAQRGGGSPASVAGAERGLAARPSLESLLVASSHMLKEVLDSPFVDPLKSLRLPRELNPNKKYSWMQKKEEQVRFPAWGLCGGAETGPQRRHRGAWLAMESEGPIQVQLLPLPPVWSWASCCLLLGLGSPVGRVPWRQPSGSGRVGWLCPSLPGGLGRWLGSLSATCGGCCGGRTA